ncbi:ankyrin repeat domain-containing protein [Bacteroides thetaiotaomicron]|uniref:ankyrin repeat domain-containing protein n=1 Tax=Bacteroides thetaiotaomicron TaxID=818 RepID=UPI0039C0CF4F
MEEENIFDEVDMLDVLVEGNVDVLDAFIHQYGLNSINEEARGILAICILEGRTDLALYLINETNINLNQADRNGYTPLHFAVQENNYSVVEALIRKKAVIDPIDKFGNTPLYKCVTEKVNINITKVLLEHGANLTVENSFGYSPMVVIQKSLPELQVWLKNEE